jgi:predicted aspartyl protease
VSRVRTGAPVAVLLSLFCLAGPAAEPLPMRIQGRVLFVDARLNGRGPFRMILDTGATETVITPPVAAKLGLVRYPSSSSRLRRVLDRIEVGPAAVDRLQVLVFDPPQALPLRLNHGIDYHGLIGYPFLSRFVTTIDYRASTVSFAPPARRPPEAAEPRKQIVIPFKLHDNLIHVRGKVGETPAATAVFLVDTGSAEVLFLPRAAQRLGLRAVAAADHDRVAFTRLGQLALGRAVVGDVPAVIHQLADERRRNPTYDAILGYPFLSRFTVTVDYRHRELRLVP